MPLVVVSTPFTEGVNSYISLEEMEEYVATRVADTAVSAAWTALTEAQKSLFVVNATRALDVMVEWIGDRYPLGILGWPRYGAIVDGYYLAVTTIPDRIKEATAEMALWTMSNSGAVTVSQNAAYDSIRVGPIAINFNEQANLAATKYYPDILPLLLAAYGTLIDPSKTRVKNVRLIRA